MAFPRKQLSLSKLRTHYDNLKVSCDAPDFVIRAAYKTLSQRYHPDKNPSPDAARIMQLLNRSYGVLSDPELRAEHDAWIRTQEAKTDSAQKAKPSTADSGSSGERGTKPPEHTQRTARRPLVLPQGGSSAADSLPLNVLKIVADRSRGRCGDQAHLPLGPTVAGTLVRAAISVAWLLLVYGLAMDSRWAADTAWWLGGGSAVFGIYFGAQIYKLHLFRARPFRPSLNVTPLYVVETTWDRVSYWPIPLVRGIQAVDHHRNGSYTHTSFELDIAGDERGYVADSKYAYASIVNGLNSGRDRYLAAEQNGRQSALDSVDDIKGVRLKDVPGRLPRGYGFLAGWTGGCVAFLLAFFVLALVNQEKSERTAPAYTRAPPSQPEYQPRPPAAAEPVRPAKDYIAERIGSTSIPDRPAYIRGEPVANIKGLSTVTVDNSQTSGDVLVKLVAIEGARAWPVRTFFIPGGGRFTAEDVSPGTYEIRYMERYSGDTSKSESFTLEETEQADGIEYSNMTLTLYKVAGGNMHMQTIDPSEF